MEILKTVTGWIRRKIALDNNLTFPEQGNGVEHGEKLTHQKAITITEAEFYTGRKVEMPKREHEGD